MYVCFIGVYTCILYEGGRERERDRETRDKLGI